MDQEDLKFLKLDLEGVKTLVGWAEKEGWNPGLYDAEVFWKTDPDGFYGYFRDGEMVGGGSLVSYNKEFGFMGFFIVKPEFRLKGIGRKLWFLRRDTLRSRLNKGASIGMDGVVPMQPFYRKGGFEIAFRDERHERLGETFQVDVSISPVNDPDMEAIMAYDLECFGFIRPGFLKRWLDLPASRAFKYTDRGQLRGFVMIRKAVRGYRVGPLFADNATVAEELYKACLNSVPGEFVCIDVPVTNEGAVSLVKRYNGSYVFECARMYYGKAPEIPVHKIFGLTTFEVG
ncbi:MAG: GNAT family N-acetyltransferase [Mangrovibacterium sp.]